VSGVRCQEARGSGHKASGVIPPLPPFFKGGLGGFHHSITPKLHHSKTIQICGSGFPAAISHSAIPNPQSEMTFPFPPYLCKSIFCPLSSVVCPLSSASCQLSFDPFPAFPALSLCALRFTPSHYPLLSIWASLPHGLLCWRFPRSPHPP
jgi:hypothetical protein